MQRGLGANLLQVPSRKVGICKIMVQNGQIRGYLHHINKIYVLICFKCSRKEEICEIRVKNGSFGEGVSDLYALHMTFLNESKP